MSKPREFWVCDVWGPIVATRITLDDKPGTLMENKDVDVFHVLEAAPVLQMLESMAEALRNIPDYPLIDNRDFYISGNANEALAAYTAFKAGLGE